MGNIQCGGALTKKCLSDDDVRYDADFPSDVLGQDERWEKFSGYFKVELFNFDAENGGASQPTPFFFPPGVGTPFSKEKVTGFYNHTIDESRMIINRYYYWAPAPQSFCESPLPPRAMNHTPGTECGVNGWSRIGGMYAATTHENDGGLDLFRTFGSYAGPEGVYDFDPAGSFDIVDDSTFEHSTSTGNLSSTSSYVFYNKDTASLSAVHTRVDSMQIVATVAGKMTRITEEEFLSGIEDANDEYNVIDADKPRVPPLSDNVIDGSWRNVYPTEDEWCGELVNDTSCTTSPYKEPDGQVEGWAIALFTILGVLIFGGVGFYLHHRRMKQQEKRIKERFVRNIARNITIAPNAGGLSAEQLKKEFEYIDRDGGGTIDKEELRTFVDSGKLGEMSKGDFEAMWAALDIDNSGEVDFVEFCTFLSGCGAEFDQVYEEQSRMTKEDKMKFASMRLSKMNLGAVETGEPVEPIKPMEKIEEFNTEE